MTPRSTGLARIWQRIKSVIRPNVVVTPAPPGIAVDWNVPVTVRDGTVLRVNVYRPQGDAPAPVIMSAHPYGKDRIPAKTRSRRGLNFQYRIFWQPAQITMSEYTSWEAPDPAFWVPNGYAVVNADLRGGGTSEGTGELMSDQEAQDYYDLVEWAAAQPWSSGRVGLDGVSYLALSQYKVAALRPPHLAAICPWEGFSDLYRDFARPGGIREDGFSIIWSRATAAVSRVRVNIRQQIVARPERDEWYESCTPDLERIEVPMLVCGSFSDHSLHSRGAFEAFRRAGSEQKYLYTHRGGKWSTYYSDDAKQAQLRFFDHTLKGLDNGLQNEPPVRLAIYDDGTEPVAVSLEREWPPADLVWTKLALDARSKTLVEHVPSDAASVPLVTRGSTVSFTWDIPEDLDIIGPMALRLYVEPAAEIDLSFFAGVRKFRNGVEATFEGSYGFDRDMVSKGWQRAAHRELDERLSTPEQPVHVHKRDEALRPGEVVALDIALRQHATRFRKGDRLQLDLRGTWPYPRDPFRGQFPVGYQHGATTTYRLHTGGSYGAYLLLGSRKP